MQNSKANTILFDRYLNLLGVERDEPTLELLGEITFSHLTRVPFENISKLYRVRCLGLRTLPTLAEHLDESVSR